MREPTPKTLCMDKEPINPADPYPTLLRRVAQCGRFAGTYFLACNGFVKIGYAHDVISRARAIWQLIPGHEVEPLGRIDGANVEGEWHIRFAAIRDKGEWFKDTAELRAAIRLEAKPWFHKPKGSRPKIRRHA